jgi:hypothetical protein
MSLRLAHMIDVLTIVQNRGTLLVPKPLSLLDLDPAVRHLQWRLEVHTTGLSTRSDVYF